MKGPHRMMQPIALVAGVLFAAYGVIHASFVMPGLAWLVQLGLGAFGIAALSVAAHYPALHPRVRAALPPYAMAATLVAAARLRGQSGAILPALAACSSLCLLYEDAEVALLYALLANIACTAFAAVGTAIFYALPIDLIATNAIFASVYLLCRAGRAGSAASPLEIALRSTSRSVALLDGRGRIQAISDVLARALNTDAHSARGGFLPDLLHGERRREAIRSVVEAGEPFDGTLEWNGVSHRLLFAPGEGGFLEWDESPAAAQAARDTEAAMRAKRDFLAGMGHEQRAPVNAIVGFRELLRRTPLDEQQAGAVDKAWDASEELLRVIDDIVDYAQLEAGTLKLHPAPFAVRPLMEELAERARRRLAGKTVRFHLIFSKDMPSTLFLDGARLRQILVSLLENAWHATHRGSVSLLAEVYFLPRGATRLVFAISDTGTSISRETLDGLLEGLDFLEDKAAAGGMGLVVSRLLAERMGGSLRVRDEPGRGPTLQLEVMSAPFPAPPLVATRGEEEVPAKARDISALVFEENPSSARAMARMLEDLGAPHILARTRKEWNAAVRSRAFTHIFLPCRETSRLAAGLPTRGARILALRGWGDRYRPVQGAETMDRPIFVDDLARVLRGGAPRIRAPLYDLRLTGARVLLADDNPIGLELAAALLRDFGAEVVTAVDEASALRALTGQPFDLLLLDRRLGDRDAVQVARAIRAAGYAGVPIVELSIGERNADPNDFFVDFLRKPVERLALARLLSMHLPQEKVARRNSV